MLSKLFGKKKPKPEPQEAEQPLAINKDSNIGELAMQYPHIAETLAEDYGLHCIGCFASSFDTLENGAQIHGMNDQEIEDMIQRLNTIHQQKMSEQDIEKNW